MGWTARPCRSLGSHFKTSEPARNPGVTRRPGARAHCCVSSILIRRLADPTVHLRRVGMSDDHLMSLADLRAFVDGPNVRYGTDYGNSH
jgi:hypothetical protein